MGLPFEDDDDRRAQLESLGEQFLINDSVTCYGILDERYRHHVQGDAPGAELMEATLKVCLADVEDELPDDPVGLPVVRVSDGRSWVLGRSHDVDGSAGMVTLSLRVQ